VLPLISRAKVSRSARLEIRSPTQACTIYDEDKEVGLYREPELRIDFYGNAIPVPGSCLKGFSFRLSDLSLAIGTRGVGIKIVGESIVAGAKMRAVVYTVNNEVLCNQSAD
jgi:hypothetical protein